MQRALLPVFCAVFALRCVAPPAESPDRDKGPSVSPPSWSQPLAIPPEDAPTFDAAVGRARFSLCAEVVPSLALPLQLSADQAARVCNRPPCHRAPEPGEVVDPEIGTEGVLVSDAPDERLLWRVGVLDGGAGAEQGAAIEAGIYAVDVRIPQMMALSENGLPWPATRVWVEVQGEGLREELELNLEPQRDRARWVGLGVFRFDPGVAEISLGDAVGAVPVSAVRLRRAHDPHFGNAAWMAYLATNQYAGFGALGPVLEDLGFGEPGEGERWRQCSDALTALRDRESARWERGERVTDDDVYAAGPCARDYWDSDAGIAARFRVGQGYAATALFHEHLVRTPALGKGIQFFSGGEVVRGELDLREGSTQALWAYHRERNVVVIAYRGTEPLGDQRLIDLATDARIWLVRARIEGPWGEVHRGFQRAYEEVASLIEAKLDEVRGDTQILLTGHSLGGALATITGAHLLARLDAEPERYYLRAIYTFGSPRVGDREFAARFHDQASRFGVEHLRYRHARDAITQIPWNVDVLGAQLFDYTHVGPMLYITEEGALQYMPLSVPSGLDRDAFEHHRMANYYRFALDASAPWRAAGAPCAELGESL